MLTEEYVVELNIYCKNVRLCISRNTFTNHVPNYYLSVPSKIMLYFCSVYNTLNNY